MGRTTGQTTTKDNDPNPSSVWLSRAGVAEMLQVSPNTVTRWAHEGRLPYQLTLGGHHRFERSVVEELRRTLRSSVGSGR